MYTCIRCCCVLLLLGNTELVQCGRDISDSADLFLSGFFPVFYLDVKKELSRFAQDVRSPLGGYHRVGVLMGDVCGVYEDFHSCSSNLPDKCVHFFVGVGRKLVNLELVLGSKEITECNLADSIFIGDRICVIITHDDQVLSHDITA